MSPLRFAATALACLAFACGSPPAEEDAGGPGVDSGTQQGADAGPDDRCTADAECSDGLFCTGVERCAPSEPEADANGCVPTASPCTEGLVCDESLGECLPDCGQALDADGDGHRNIECGGDDCDDMDPNRYPGNVEVCDGEGHDEDCNTDTFGFLDADSDGSASAVCCNGINCGEDCNDGDSTINPRAGDGPPLSCDGVDNDCSDTADEGCPCTEGQTRPCGTPTQIAEIGLCRPGTQVCSGGEWTATCIGGVAPQEEVCDGVDNDCNGTDDNGVLRTYFADGDGDGFGDPTGQTVDACSPPDGFASNDSDCDDSILAVNPLATEVCNLIDDDCDSETDEGVLSTFFEDSDGDAFGNPLSSLETCTRPDGYVTNGVDCDDGERTVNPPATEVCDGIDNNCDMDTDPGCTCTDGDTQPCGPSDGAGGILVEGECRAGSQRCQGGVWGVCNGSREPNPEACNTRDDDCDGTTDETVQTTFYEDGDGDGFGDAASTLDACDVPPGYSRLSTDCDDGAAAINPSATEQCDGIDNNCGGGTDEGCNCVNGTTQQCGTTDVGVCEFGEQLCVGGLWGTCAGSTEPRTPEVCDGADDDCDNSVDEELLVTCYSDADDDGWAGAGAATQDFCPVAGRAAEGGCPIFWTDRTPTTPDCADDNPARSPGRAEVCNGLEDDCDGAVDEDTTTECAVADGFGACLAGSCGVVECEFGFGDCDGEASNGCETDVTADRENCGACGSSCGGGVCAGGLCEGVLGVTAGGQHGCAWFESGAVGCWGENGFAQLASGDRIDRLTPGVVPGLVADRVEAGSSHSIALHANGTLSAWGSNFRGQCGTGGAAVEEAPTPISGLTGVLDIAASSQVGCAATGTTVHCWGDNFGGRLGDGTQTNRPTPVSVVGISDGVRVATGGVHTCAVLSGGGVRCWGFGTEGQLGDGNQMSSNTPVVVSGITDAVDVAGSSSSACALLATGHVTCWGHNASGELGDTTTTNRPAPVLVSGLVDAVELTAGRSHFCARRAAGEVTCWGANFDGQLGDGTTTPSSVPVPVPGLFASSISAHASHTCAVRTDGRTLCWGNNDGGQLGDGSVASRLDPGPVVGISDVVEISSLGRRTCARYSTGRAACWGDNFRGGVGDGTTTDRNVPTPVLGVSDAVDLDAGSFGASNSPHGCIIRTGGQAMCWGRNLGGQVGDGTRVQRLSPVNVSGMTDAIAIQAAGSAGCALHVDHTVSCWGAFFNDDPTPVPGIAEVVDISEGSQFRCALRADGHVLCWGGNQSGQTANGEVSNLLVTAPNDVGLTDAIAVSAGGEHACALRSGGTVSCWGRNSSGQLGDGTLLLRTSPVGVLGLNLVVEITTGGNHTCARRATGETFCWGSNANGQLGDGTQADRLAPVAVSGLGAARELAGGSAHTCARLLGQQTYCWGQNTDGQLGIGTFADVDVPTLVQSL